ncbi:efflux RND transporter permease subunit [Flammeovirga sp. OC4]|uniref:efflux RND transporter permease subunit n=1 Tax=Flammeovirga sp. OC4 TaxID=1382345 RepID=UPI0005C764B8|nr:efflux RND transporter permease subunit [Flammeovirga sp. OC4]
MIKTILERPIAMLMIIILFLSIGYVSCISLSISLLPDIDIPKLTVKIKYDYASPITIENQVLRKLRENLKHIDNVTKVESEAYFESGQLELYFNHGTDMVYSFIEVNERIDQLRNLLPEDVERPVVIQSSTSDLPIMTLQVIPNTAINYNHFSQLAKVILKKRIETVKGVSMVDFNGIDEKQITVNIDRDLLDVHGIDINIVLQKIKNVNLELGYFFVKENNLLFKAHVDQLDLYDIEGLRQIIISNNGFNIIRLKDIATIEETSQKKEGLHLFNLERSIVFNIHKQNNARFNIVHDEILALINQFRNDYPDLSFQISKNQYPLIRSSIDNLVMSILLGGIISVTILLLFNNNLFIPLIMGFCVPISIITSFTIFNIFHLSINIISLGGLALGVGMIIDNAIILIDNITLKYNQFKSSSINDLKESCIKGTKEVIPALISSTLTTMCIYLPIIMINGIVSELFLEHCIAVGATLFCSLITSIIIVPLLYFTLWKYNKPSYKAIESTVFNKIASRYKVGHHLVTSYPKNLIALTVLITVLGVSSVYFLDKKILPDLSKKDINLIIKWNDKIDLPDSKIRYEKLIDSIKKEGIVFYSSTDIGVSQYKLDHGVKDLQTVNSYLNFNTFDGKGKFIQLFDAIFKERFPNASYKFTESDDPLNQLISIIKEDYYKLLFRNTNSQIPLKMEKLNTLKNKLLQLNPFFIAGNGSIAETKIKLKINESKLNYYHLNLSDIKQQLEVILNGIKTTKINNYTEIIDVVVKEKSSTRLTNILYNNYIAIDGKQHRIPLSEVVEVEKYESYKNIKADELGIYHDFILTEDHFHNDIDVEALNTTMNVTKEGKFFQINEQLNNVLFIAILSILVLYMILSAHFESITQPLIIVVTLPIGISGSLILLLLFQQSLNIISMIGIVVMLGIMVNDAILKMDTVNRLKKENSTLPLEQIVYQASMVRLKPILMTSLTTMLAVIPILFSDSIGSDLQKPMAISIIGGVGFGTLTALFFVPLIILFINKK